MAFVPYICRTASLPTLYHDPIGAILQIGKANNCLYSCILCGAPHLMGDLPDEVRKVPALLAFLKLCKTETTSNSKFRFIYKRQWVVPFQPV